jgi:hypothetical protein
MSNERAASSCRVCSVYSESSCIQLMSHCHQEPLESSRLCEALTASVSVWVGVRVWWEPAAHEAPASALL